MDRRGLEIRIRRPTLTVRPDIFRWVSRPRKVVSGAATGQICCVESPRGERRRIGARPATPSVSDCVAETPLRASRSARAARPRPLRSDSGSCRQWTNAEGRAAAGARSSVASRSGGRQAVLGHPGLGRPVLVLGIVLHGLRDEIRSPLGSQVLPARGRSWGRVQLQRLVVVLGGAGRRSDRRLAL